MLSYLFITIIALSNSSSPKNIAVVHSYNHNFTWVKEVNQGIDAYLQGRKLFNRSPRQLLRDYSIRYFYMDAKVAQLNSSELIKKASPIVTNIKELSPELVVICDDEALEYVAKPLMGRSSLRFVFLGVNNDPRKYGVVTDLKAPDKNVTGLVSEHPFQYSIKLMRQLVGDKKQLYVFFDDSVSAKGILNNWKDAVDDLNKNGVTTKIVEYIVSSDWEHWKRKIKALQAPENVFVIGTFYSIRSKRGKILTTDEVSRWIIENSKVPEITILTSHIKEGFLLSISNPGFVHGYEAFAIVESIILGKEISEIAVSTPRQKAVRLNMKRAAQLKIEVPLEIISLAKYFEEMGY